MDARVVSSFIEIIEGMNLKLWTYAGLPPPAQQPYVAVAPVSQKAATAAPAAQAQVPVRYSY